jgi:protein-glutamine gamma-glutamyltransferase
LYSTAGTLKLSALFLSLRRFEGTKEYSRYTPRIDMSYPYLIGCLLSASTSKTEGFFIGICLLVAWMLWQARHPRYSVKTWVTLWLTACLLAYMGHLGIYELQTQVENLILQWFEQRGWHDLDPYQQHTAMGDIGRLKQSENIILRVNSPYPVLLRQASYNTYYKTSWYARKAPFQPLTPNSEDETSWSFSNSPLTSHSLAFTISTYLYQGKGMLALPFGTYQVTHLPVLTMQRNDFGAVKVEEGPGLIKYTAYASQTSWLDAPPTEKDLYIFEEDRAIFTEVANRLNLKKLSNQSASQGLDTIKHFFANNFQYSLDLTQSESDLQSNIQGKPLEYFLRDSHAGHCEYFATATVLLLRTVGIPARYAAGYSVSEWSELEQLYVVRQRHAHAWTLAYVDGHWQELDTTPTDWNNLEESLTGWWQPLSDLWSWMLYRFYWWRWQPAEETSNHWFLWLILPLSLILIWRIYKQQKVQTTEGTSETQMNSWPGADSAFYEVVQQLQVMGYVRSPEETLTTWLKRIPATILSNDIQTMLSLHQRYRFDPVGMSEGERMILTTQVEKWIVMKCG